MGQPNKLTISFKNDEPHITIRAVQPVVSALQGQKVPAILQAAKISSVLINDPDARIPHSRMMALWQKSLAATHGPDWGLHLAEAEPIAAFEVHTYAILARSRCRRESRYSRSLLASRYAGTTQTKTGGNRRQETGDAQRPGATVRPSRHTGYGIIVGMKPHDAKRSN